MIVCVRYFVSFLRIWRLTGSYVDVLQGGEEITKVQKIALSGQTGEICNVAGACIWKYRDGCDLNIFRALMRALLCKLRQSQKFGLVHAWL